MCGILFTDNPAINQQSFGRSLDLMQHRGPDADSGFLQYKNYKLGHKRLKILDLDNRSNQPYRSHDGRYVIIFNGEIYNFQELARQYNIRLVTSSDTEVILELYAQQGPRMLRELNGMFAMVILDTLEDQVFVARDRLGIKPLYFAQEGNNTILASEIASILPLLDSAAFDPIGLRQYRKLRTFFHGHTLYSSIRMFPAGHYSLSGKLQKYWELPEGEQVPPSDEELKELIVSAVDYRCIADVPVGSYLSGGLDSTIVAGLASKPHTWTVGFEDTNEFQWAELAAERFKSRHSAIKIAKNEFVELARAMIQKRGEPLSVPNEVLLYKMTQEVKKKNTVVLSGEGADELFFGYDRIFRWAANNHWDLKQFDELYSYGSHEDLEIIDYALGPVSKSKTAIAMVARFFQVSHLHGLLRRLDNSTMLCSVEARVPFVDHRLVERMAGVPFESRMENGIVKFQLKRVFEDLIPIEIRERVKVGFPVPLDSLDFGVESDTTPMDKWLKFNLSELGVPENSH